MAIFSQAFPKDTVSSDAVGTDDQAVLKVGSRTSGPENLATLIYSKLQWYWAGGHDVRMKAYSEDLQRLAMKLTYATSLLALPAARRGLSSSSGTLSTSHFKNCRYALVAS